MDSGRRAKVIRVSDPTHYLLQGNKYQNLDSETAKLIKI